LKILVVGFGSMGFKHYELLRKRFPEATIRVLRHGRNFISNDIENISIFSLENASKFAPELVVIANPAPFHIQTGLYFAKEGANLFIEKPISNSDVEVRDLIDFCRSRSIKLAVGYNLRFLQSLVAFRKNLQDGIVGRPIYAKSEVGQYLPDWRKKTDYRISVTAQTALGGGVLLELSHELDYLRWIFGEFEWVQAALHKSDVLEMDAENLVFFEGKINDSVSSNTIPVQGSLDCLRRDMTRSCTVVGTRGTLIWDGVKDDVTLISDSEKSPETVFMGKNQMSSTYEAQWDDYFAALESDKDPITTGEDALKTLEVLLAIRESSVTRSRVNLDHKW